jgi:Sec-independent protein translocase protein TatA
MGSMFALSRGELAIVLFIFALVWGAGELPRLGEALGARFAMKRGRDRRDGPSPAPPERDQDLKGG